jgi:hypothetical protein
MPRNLSIEDANPRNLLVRDTKPENLLAVDLKPKMAKIDRQTLTQSISKTIPKGMPMICGLGITYPDELVFDYW